MPTGKRPSLKRILWSVLVLIILISGAVIYAANAPTKIERDTAAIRELGYPTTDADVDALFPPPQGENSLPYFVQFRESVRTLIVPKSKPYIELTIGHVDRLPDNKLIADLGSCQDLDDHVMKAASLPGWTDGRTHVPVGEFDSESFADQAVRLLSGEAIAYGRMHNVPEAMKRIDAAQKISKLAAQFKPVAGYTLPANCDFRTTEAIKDIARNNPDPTSLDLIAKTMENFAPIPDFLKNYDGEFVQRAKELEIPVEQRHNLPLFEEIMDRFVYEKREQRAKDLSMHIYREVFERIHGGSSDPASVYQYAEDEKMKHASELATIREFDTPALIEMLCNVWMTQLARRRVVLMGIRMMQAKPRSGSYPPTLGSFYGEDAIDPFTGKPLMYRPDPKGFVLYSVGADRKDDGGVEMSLASAGADIVFRVP